MPRKEPMRETTCDERLLNDCSAKARLAHERERLWAELSEERAENRNTVAYCKRLRRERDEAVAGHPIFTRLLAEIVRQDEKHGPFEGATQLGRSRLAMACLEDEIAEALNAWRDERNTPTWDHTREEVLQIAAVAIRVLRDAL